MSFVFFCFSVLLAFGFAEITAGSSKPNVIIIVIDDLGHHDVGFSGSAIHTPNIDALRAEGVVLSNYYVKPVCSPTRSEIMTGRFDARTGIYTWLHPATPQAIPLNETLLPQVLNAGGYVSHAVGKWHLGFYTWAATPTFRGFSSFLGFYTGGEDYFQHTASANGFDFRYDASPRCGANCSAVLRSAIGHYSTDVFSDRAVAIVQGYNSTAPLFLYLAYQGVHSPAECPPHYEAPYGSSVRKTFSGMLSAVDVGVGRLVSALQQKGLFENSVIVFTADNGGPTTTGDGIGASNWPLRGGKHSTWEGGVRVAGFVRAPSLGIHPGGSVSCLMNAVDWLPTIASLTGVAVGTTLPLDGVDATPCLRHNATVRSHTLIGTGGDGGLALRSGRFKLMVSIAGEDAAGGLPNTYSLPDTGRKVNTTRPSPPRTVANRYWPNTHALLFDVDADPYETVNVADQHPEELASMSRMLRAYYEDRFVWAANRFPKGNPVDGVWQPWVDDSDTE